ncbi:hypothetical protein QAD02_013208 [Eretmocerus hayati]|uniref:Uncharacterized protein n=1 Tax=Eretmocerus hayati TaxID=131215 RepID=A0ACC2P1W7_9HYME|nr:hypothetical protein QAD02_013208 [Eretmocerus hayati]
MRKLFLDAGFDGALNEVGSKTWLSVKEVMKNSLGNNTAENYRILVAAMLDNFRRMEVNQSLKIHMLDSHLDFFPNNLGAVSDEIGERFHQEIADLGSRYNVEKSVNMLADHVWNMIFEESSTHGRKSARTSFKIM